jgi:hypothetical protein
MTWQGRRLHYDFEGNIPGKPAFKVACQDYFKGGVSLP